MPKIKIVSKREINKKQKIKDLKFIVGYYKDKLEINYPNYNLKQTYHNINEIKGKTLELIGNLLVNLSTEDNLSIINYIQKIDKALKEQNKENFSGITLNDELLIGRQAKVILHKSLQNNSTPFEKDTVYSYISDEAVYVKSFPRLQKNFKIFYNSYYKQGKSYRNDLLQVVKVTDDDPRVALHGQDKVIAKTFIPKNKMLGIYTGIILNNDYR